MVLELKLTEGCIMISTAIAIFASRMHVWGHM